MVVNRLCVCVCAYDRSLCSLVCKWLYEADNSNCGWNKEFMSDIGLANLAVDSFRKIGKFKNFELFFCCLELLLRCKVVVLEAAPIYYLSHKIYIYNSRTLSNHKIITILFMNSTP